MDERARRRGAERGAGAPAARPGIPWRERVDVRRVLLRLAAVAIASAAIVLVARVAILVYGDADSKARHADGVVDRATGVVRPDASR